MGVQLHLRERVVVGAVKCIRAQGHSTFYCFHCTLVQRHSNSKKLVHGACTAKLFNREATSLNSFNSFNS